MLQAVPSHDRKWMKMDIRGFFSEEGLTKLWSELVKDGEVKGTGASYQDYQKQEAESVKFKSSPFETFLAEWTWGEEPVVEHLKESLHTLVLEQQDLAHKAALSTLSLGRLHQRLLVMERFFLAMTRKGVTPTQLDGQGAAEEELELDSEEKEEGGTVKPEVPEQSENKMKDVMLLKEKRPTRTSSVESPSNLATACLARVGAHAALSFTFSFLKRAWHSGEESDLCVEVLQDALVTMQALPVAILFDVSSISPIWLEVVDRTMKFLITMQKGSCLVEKAVPLADRQVAMSLLLELTLQRGTLGHILDALLLLLSLSNLTPSTPDKNRRAHAVEEEEVKRETHRMDQSSDEGNVFPLVMFLRRLASIPTPVPPFLYLKAGQETQTSTTCKSYLECHTLPNDDTVQLELMQVAAVTMAHLDRIAEPYNAINKAPEGSEDELVQVLHWGDVHSQLMAETLLDLGVKQLATSEKSCIALTTQGVVYNMVSLSAGGLEAIPSVLQFPKEVKIVQLAHHSQGSHFLVLSSNGNVYSWGSGGAGQLGHNDNLDKENPTQVNSLFGKNVVFVAAGASYSAAVTTDGLLYTWGKGTQGRLGHGNTEDMNVPTHVENLVGHKIVDVDCGSEEDAHTLALDSNGAVWSWGDGDFGKLGCGGSSKVPKMIPNLKEVVKVRCGEHFSVALTKRGEVYTWGSADFHQLGHGNLDHLRNPKLVAALGEENVTMIAVAIHHMMALSKSGNVHVWGKYSSEETNESVDGVSLPKLLPEASKRGVIYIACGPSESFAFCKHQSVSLGKKLPFCLDLTSSTFEKLDFLLQSVCECLDEGRRDHGGQGCVHLPTHKDQECIAVSALNLLNLQLYAASVEASPPSELGFNTGSPLLVSLKQCVVKLARSLNILPSVQQAAQAVLQTGWKILLPTVSERASALLHLLPNGDASSSGPSVPPGQQFMINLLLNSMMVENELEDALMTAIAYEMQDPTLILKEAGIESSVPLLQLVQQLMNNSTGRQLALLEQVSGYTAAPATATPDDERGGGVGWEVVASDSTAANELLLLFQKLLVGHLYSHSSSFTTLATPSSATSPHPISPPPTFLTSDHHIHQHIHGAIAVLVKYVSMVHYHIVQVLPAASELISQHPQLFKVYTKVLRTGPVEVLLPDLSVSLLLLQVRLPVEMVASKCFDLIGNLIDVLDKFNRLTPSAFVEDSADLAWPDTYKFSPPSGTFPEATTTVPLISREELDRHNEEEHGSWLLVDGRVYDAHTLAERCPYGIERLAEWVERDGAGHSQATQELVDQCCVGTFGEDVGGAHINNVLADTERTLAVLQGLRACFMVQGLPVFRLEEECDKWLSLEMFSSGLELQPLSSSSASSSTPLSPKLGMGIVDAPLDLSRTKSLQRPSISSHCMSRSFLYGLSNGDTQDEKVAMFLFLIQRYCQRKNLYLPHIEQVPDHPVVRFGHLFTACLLKMHDLIPIALSVIEQEGLPNNEQDSISVRLPPSLAEMCKLVYEAKISLVKAHQESLCSYEEVCKEPIARCSFIVDYVRSPMLNVMSILHRHQMQSITSRWRSFARRVLAKKRQQQQQQQQDGKSTEAGQSVVEGSDDAHSKKGEYTRKTSLEVKRMKEAVNWDKMNPEIAGGRKFKWLREKRGISSHHATLLVQIKNFILTDEVDVKVLHRTLQRQVARAHLRMEGVKYLFEILQQESLLPSVKYAIICGWLGVIGSTDGRQQTVSKPHYLCNVELVYPILRTRLELMFQELNEFMIRKLRRLLWEAKMLGSKRQASTASKKKDGEKSHAATTCFAHLLDKYTISRFVVAYLGMLTCEHEAIDISKLINSGLLGLSQSVINLSETTLSIENEPIGPNKALNLQQDTYQGQEEQDEVTCRFLVGTVVVRGPDWKWGDQDGPPPSRGTVISELNSDYWIRVRWDSGSVNSYRMVEDGKYDLALASEIKESSEGESKDHPMDAELTLGMSVPYPAELMATSLILQSSVCLLRSMAVAFSIHSHELPCQTSFLLSNLLLHIMQCGKKESLRNRSGMNMVLANECEMWATLGLLRGMSSLEMSGRAFCTRQWMELMMETIKKASPLSPPSSQSKSLLQEVLMLRLMRAVLPSWEAGSNIKQQQKLVEDLFSLLGQVLVLCSSPFLHYSLKAENNKSGKSKRMKFNASMTASESSTIAEEIVVLLRRLHPLPAWNPLINQFISDSLQAIPFIIVPLSGDHKTGQLGMDPKLQLRKDVSIHGPVLAVLTVIGGLDSRPRLGGMVQHEDLGVGTIAKVECKGKTTIYFHEQKKAKMCSLTTVKPIPVLSFQVDQLPMSETVMGIWSCLVRLAGNSSSAIPSVDEGSLFQPPSSKRTGNAALLPVPEQVATSGHIIYILLLRQEQIRLGLLKAARVLFSQQENLGQIMARPTTAEGDQFSLFQQLLSAATRPSPIKAIFSRDELEAAAVSMCQYLASEVHKPYLEGDVAVAAMKVKAPEEAKAFKKKSFTSKKAAAKHATSAATATQQQKSSTASAKPVIAAPSPVVSQIIEMGFERRYVEYAIQTTSSTSPERLINWLIEHQGIELPEMCVVATPTTKTTHSRDELQSAALNSGGGDGKDVEDSESLSESELSEDIVEAEGSAEFKGLMKKKYKQRGDFSSPDDYSRYVRDNISVGIMVRCCEGYEEVRLGDVGRIMKVDNDGLHDLNVQANWQQKGGTYWVRFGHCELLGDVDSAGVVTFKAGDKVRVRRGVSIPKYKWGSVTHQSVGLVRSINRNGTDVCVDFPEQNNWTGLISEMEQVPGIHPRQKCDGCSATPIEGSRFHCQVCANFDFCQGCFNKGQGHNHAFERIDDHGQTAVYVGSPRSRKKALKRKKKKIRGGSVVMEWDQIVKCISVSSSEDLAYRLMDGNQTTCWQSSGNQGKHWIRLEIQPSILVEQLSIQVEKTDSSYMPNTVVVLVGSFVGCLKELKQLTVPSTCRECILVTGLTEYYSIVEISIRSCKSGGIDARVHGVSIIGRVDMNEEEAAANFSFLTVEEVEGKDVGLIRRQRKIDEGLLSDSSLNTVFVWGLNDRHQLGCMQADPKIKTPIDNRNLAKLNPSYLAGGSKTLFIVSQDGKVYSCGEGTNGRLGNGVVADVVVPKVLTDLSMYVVRKVAVNAGSRHAMALTADGKAFSWGDGEYGQLGHGDNKSYHRPRMIESLQGKHVREIACGSGHSAAITANGELYTWGQGDHGRLGHGNNTNQARPKQVKYLEKYRVMYVACGSRDAQTLAATENGHLYAWGDGCYGKLGQKELVRGSVKPVMIKDFGKEGVAQLECGIQFSVLLTKSGKVYTWGKGDYYRLGSDSSSHLMEPHLVEGMSEKVVQIAVGSLHCLALSDTSQVYSWGDNEHGQQGNGSTMSNKKPQLISALVDQHITSIACGSSHCVALASGGLPSSIEFTPVSFQMAHDPLATSISFFSSSSGGRMTEDGTHSQTNDSKRPSLIKIILSLQTPLKQQEALAHILTSLQIAYARDAIVNSLGGVASAAQKRSSEEGQVTAAEISASIPTSPCTLLRNSDLGGAVCGGEEGVIVTEKEKDFTSILTVEDARVMVDLLKLAVANRVGEKGKENLAAVLTTMGRTNPTVAGMLMALCISELEAVSREPQSGTAKAMVQESPHPYPDNYNDSKIIRIPGAEALIVNFDAHCSTERRHDTLTIKDGGGGAVAIRSGWDVSDWSQDIRIIGEEMTWSFKSDGSVNGWGFKFTVHPIMPKKSPMGTLLSDRALQSRPSIDLVTCLLDFQLGRIPDRETLSQLGEALASCAQLNVLEASQRMWAIQHLRRLIDTASNLHLSGGMMTSLHSLVRVLPDTLFKQYNYEISHVTGGSQLMHSPFFQSMVGLACDLMLDSMECCGDGTTWSWFKQYCMAARMAKALQRRMAIPQECLSEVNERIESLQLPVEVSVQTKDHEDHSLFREQHDEQLLLWTQRYPKDWTIPLGNSFSIYGWGHNHRGQLGGIEGNRIKMPKLCESFSELNPTQIIGGEQTMFAVTNDGKVYASGYGAYGRLGIGGTENVATPTLIPSLSSRGVIIKKLSVHSGGKHCLAITTHGALYSWGEGDDGKLGIGGTGNRDNPQLVESLKDKKVVEIACGSSHSACILEDGSLYTWGKGRYGRLGHDDHEPQHKPKQVMAVKHEHVTSVALGSGDAQSLCCTVSGIVYSWGDGDYGKLGRGGNEGCKVPKKIDMLCGKDVVKLMCGSQFSIALTQKGHVYTWGKGDYFRLGHGDDTHQRAPKRVLGVLSQKKVVDISCGSLHCLVCTSDGKVYTWGDNDEGQIGNDSTIACQNPYEIHIPDNVHMDHVTCGSAHSIAWSSLRRKVVCRLPDKIPIEFNLLQDFRLPVLHNRLVLLHYFSNQFCRSLSMFGLAAGHEGVFGGFDHLRFIISSNAKEAAFRRVIKATMTLSKQYGPCIELNRIQVKRSRRTLEVDGSKTVFGQMCSKWSILTQEDLLLNQRIWKVKFVGESVDDCGGGYSESIAEMCDELQNGSLPLLIQTPNGRDDTGVNRDCFIINPKAISHTHLNMFRFLGTLIGIAVRTGSPINLVLAPPMWKQLVGLPLTLDDLSEIDSDYVQGLLYIRDNPESLVGIEFSAPNSTGEAVRLHHSWTHLTKENSREYVQLSTQFRLHEFAVQIQAIREGMAKVIPIPLLSLFTGSELETMVCGSREISISLLKSVTTYKGVDATSPLSRWFWEVMTSFNQTERSLFLRFVWGRTRLPRTASDFRGRDFVLQILDKYHPPDYYLPESYTCFFLLKLPRYSCKPVLEEKLCYAINFCKSIDTDEYAHVNLQEDLVMAGEEEDVAEP